MKEGKPVYVCSRKLMKFGREGQSQTAFLTLPQITKTLFKMGDVLQIKIYENPTKIVIEELL
jgi:hypothetical protein